MGTMELLGNNDSHQTTGRTILVRLNKTELTSWSLVERRQASGVGREMLTWSVSRSSSSFFMISGVGTLSSSRSDSDSWCNSTGGGGGGVEQVGEGGGEEEGGGRGGGGDWSPGLGSQGSAPPVRLWVTLPVSTAGLAGWRVLLDCSALLISFMAAATSPVWGAGEGGGSLMLSMARRLERRWAFLLVFSALLRWGGTHAVRALGVFSSSSMSEAWPEDSPSWNTQSVREKSSWFSTLLIHGLVHLVGGGSLEPIKLIEKLVAWSIHGRLLWESEGRTVLKCLNCGSPNDSFYIWKNIQDSERSWRWPSLRESCKFPDITTFSITSLSNWEHDEKLLWQCWHIK